MKFDQIESWRIGLPEISGAVNNLAITGIQNGFDKAFYTILDSHLTTLIAGFFLYAYGTGAVRGFAVTLNVGILANLYTALFVSRAIFDTALKLNPRAERLSI